MLGHPMAKRAAEGPARGAGAAQRARPASMGLLPVGWEEAFDPGHGRAYFFNRGTGARSWERPKVPAGRVEGGGSAEHSGALPEGWTEGFDPRHNRAYFFCTATGVTQWQRPERPAAEVSGGSPPLPPEFTPAAAFVGPREGCYFGTREQGTGYYRDVEGRTTARAAGAVPPLEGRAAAPPVPEDRAGAGNRGRAAGGGFGRGRGRGRGRGHGRGGSTGPLHAGMQVAKADGSAYVLPKDPFRKTEGYARASTTAFREETAKLAAERRASGRGRGRGRGRAGHTPGDAFGGAGRGGGKRVPPAAVAKAEGHDPMDPAAYSTAPRGGWGVGLGRDG